jgi:hypothetical protein
VFDPDASVGEAALMSTRGALRFATGRLKAVTKKDITISTPLAMLGIRGTDVWTDGTHGVLAVQPIVDVTSQSRTVTLALKNQGTLISATAPPTPPRIWTAQEIADALGQTSFNVPQQQGPNQNRRGQNQPDNQGPTQQYAVNGNVVPYVAATIGVATIATVIVVNQEDNKKKKHTSNPNKPASP